MATQYPEARVLIIMTGGTICMKSSPEGLVPARGFLEQGMAPRPSFNDGSQPGMYVIQYSFVFHLQLVLCFVGARDGGERCKWKGGEIRLDLKGRDCVQGKWTPVREVNTSGPSSVARLL